MIKGNRKMLTLLPLSFLLLGCNGDTGAEGAEDLGKDLNYTVTGIEPGAGTMELADNLTVDYDNLSNWEIETSSTAGMITSLDQAIQNEEPIVVTGWIPHWKFEEYNLKFLDDPENTFGEEEDVHTIAREGLAEDMPEAYEILDNFHWETEDMQGVILAAQDLPFEEAAGGWVDANRDYVDELVAGVDMVDGDSIQLISTPWDTERSSAHVMQIILEEQGYDVTITNVDPVIMFQAIGTGDGDASLAPWLPTTHGSFMDTYGENIDDLGVNMTGTLIGLVVPDYMDIDSVEDLPAND
ncbi:glycine betaine ABC transporter substrate-binding protein [Alkalibacterium olivapovliticus]|uniref:Glycine betaine/proline transport system substrate-binding protein n=1 Tax=Alkalibacterium olivapovliticus TaxID=99907 RepID=A0A2T0W8U7_9LACT|nr:glycine betaine ABC transporter substrate-binding protein [Alkalibacterium olivapovliticus]PRY83109.1 glycine betaine/proline transport system substrate-binding protein [Alkalibacterium olivapovliticus]